MFFYMNQHLEKEYKTLLTKEQFDTLYDFLKPADPIKQVNYYFDTVHHQIRNNRGALRIREKQGVYLFTLKIRKNDDTLYEFEKPLSGNDLQALQDAEVQSLLKKHGICEQLQLIGTLTTWRAMCITDYAEICLDKNLYNNTIDYEIEYEYTQEHDGLSQFQSILDIVQIRYLKNCSSKIARALHS